MLGMIRRSCERKRAAKIQTGKVEEKVKWRHVGLRLSQQKWRKQGRDSDASLSLSILIISVYHFLHACMHQQFSYLQIITYLKKFYILG